MLAIRLDAAGRRKPSGSLTNTIAQNGADGGMVGYDKPSERAKRI